ncbi:TetR/AcrR family transcriptional regulator [Haloarchaeobius amylolyticus]|uniref:TetR/AcrR family transcriptional regulator n=1 Tax=Haloarchaeobius amylolyticus TaxID=1198296 RepID=A0ABD6BGY1_9EURY
MDDTQTPFDESAGGKEAIFAATYRTLETDGYADLSMGRVADQAAVSKSTIYHHFESKDDLVREFAESLLMLYGDELVLETEGNALESVERLLDLALFGKTADGEHLAEFVSDEIHRVYLELRTQAVHDPDYRAYFDGVDRQARERLAAVIEAGIEDGIFRDVDPDAVAGTLYLFVEGALFLGCTTGDTEWLADVRDQLDTYLEGLVRDEFAADS